MRWLGGDSHPHVTDAQRAAERLGDGVDRVHRLVRAGVPSDEARGLCNDLCAYAWPTLLAKIETEEIFNLCAQRYSIMTVAPTAEEREALRASHDERAELAVGTLPAAIDPFCQLLLAGGWNPDRGACLAIYFVGGCINRFPGVFASWRQDRQQLLRPLALDDQLTSTADPAEQLLHRDLIRLVLIDAPPETEALCELIRLGYSITEAAAHLRTTPAPHASAYTVSAVFRTTGYLMLLTRGRSCCSATSRSTGKNRLVGWQLSFAT